MTQFMSLKRMNEELILKAGKIVSEVRELTREEVVLNADFLSIVEFAETKIKELGGEIAWVQINDTTTAAHFSPTKSNNPICQSGDLIKVDIGVHIEGYIADTAFSVAIPTKNEETQKRNELLIETSKESLENALAIAHTGCELKDLGIAQMTPAKEKGLTTITNLGGHSIDQYTVHSGITIPTYDNGDTSVLKEGMTIAIEPFITDGESTIKESGEATVFMQVINRQTRNPYGRKILQFIKPRQGLPFATKDLEKEFGESVTKVGLRDLLQQGIIKGYPPLISSSGNAIAQTEHSVLVKEQSIVYTK